MGASESKQVEGIYDCICHASMVDAHGLVAKHGMDEAANDLREACNFTVRLKDEKGAKPKEK